MGEVVVVEFGKNNQPHLIYKGKLILFGIKD